MYVYGYLYKYYVTFIERLCYILHINYKYYINLYILFVYALSSILVNSTRGQGLSLVSSLLCISTEQCWQRADDKYFRLCRSQGLCQNSVSWTDAALDKNDT